MTSSSLDKFDQAVKKKCYSSNKLRVSRRVSSLPVKKQIRLIAHLLSPDVPFDERLKIVQNLPVGQRNSIARSIPIPPGPNSSITVDQWADLTRDNLQAHSADGWSSGSATTVPLPRDSENSFRTWTSADSFDSDNWWDYESTASDGVPPSVVAEERYIAERPRLQGIDREALREGGDPSEFRRLRTELWTQRQGGEAFLGLAAPQYPAQVYPDRVDIGRLVAEPPPPV